MDNLTKISLGGAGIVDVFKAVGKAIGIVILGVRGMTESITTVIDFLNVLFNKAKELANFFGGSFNIDPNANFTAFRIKRNVLAQSSVGMLLLNSANGISDRTTREKNA